MSEKINDYLLIGDLHTSALVSKKASIDWMCLPHFDSPSVFAKILDEKGGEFSVITDYKSRSEYVKDTAIAKTTFTKGNKSFEIKDFMVPQPKRKIDTHILVRKIKSLKGENEIVLKYQPKIDYGKKYPKITYKSNYLMVKLKEGRFVLHLPENAEIEQEKNGCRIKLRLKQNEEAKLILEHCFKKSDYKNRDLEKQTEKYWKKWVSKGKFFEFCRDRLVRSAITLKLMQFYPTGALIASPTTSLPEAIKGNRNWDYRYSWIRDATFTLYAFYVLGYTEEAKKFFDFIEKISEKFAKRSFELEILYTIEGKNPPKERNLNHLSGYKNSKPIRVGNSASKQFQLDTYGVLIDSYYFMLNKGFKISKRKKKIILDLIKKIEKCWEEEDSGIWEFRKSIHDYTYSKVVSWVGVNRALRICDLLNLEKEQKENLHALEEKIKYWIWNNSFDYEKKKLMRYPKSKYQDSTNFLFVLMQFLDKRDPLTKKIIKNTRKELVHNDVFTYRYIADDEFNGDEGAFILCTFWMISALSIMENVKEAEKLFRKFEKQMDECGLMSEEINPKTKNYLGNYPQAFSHMGYIMSAYYIDKYKEKLKNKKSKR